MTDNFMDRYFSADAAAKASVVLPPSAPARRGTSMEDAVTRDLSSGKETLVGWLYGHEARMTEAENYYRAGQDDKADEIIDNEDAMLEANRAGIHRIAASRDGTNKEANAIYAIARSIGKQEYKTARSIRRAEDGKDGPEYTIGQLHSKKADSIKRAGIEGYQFHNDACEGYFGRFTGPDPYADENGDPTRDSEDFKGMIQSCNRMFIDPELRLGSPAVPSELRQQRIAGCDFVNKNARRLYDTFGKDGSEDFVRTVVARSGKAGGMDKIMDCALGFYEHKKANGQVVRGSDAANEFFDTITSVSGADIGDADFRNAAMGIIESVKSSGKTIDLSSPVARRSIALGLSILAKGYADGYNLLQIGGDQGKNIQKYLGDFVTTNYETGTIPQNNPLSQIYSFHGVLMNLVTPNGKPLTDPDPSGNPKTYMKSASSGAGNAAKGFMSALEREAVPYFMSGKSHMDAISSIRFDIDGAVPRISAAVARSMGIPEPTARKLTNQMLSYVGNGGAARGPINIEGMMNDLAMKDVVAKSWYTANVSDADRYAESRARTKEHLMSPFVGLSEREADARLAQLDIKADKAVRRGEDPNVTVYGKEVGTGVFLVPTGKSFTYAKKEGTKEAPVSKDGSIKPGAVRQFRFASGSLDRAFEKDDEAVMYNGIPIRNGGWSANPDEFRRLQKAFREEYAEGQKTLRQWMGRTEGGNQQGDDSYRAGE